jgi:hypothetical protein
MRTLSQLKKDLYVRIDKDWFNEETSYIKKYGHNALLINSYLQRGITNRNEIYFSIDNIAEYLHINPKNFKSRQNIINTLYKFNDDKLFKLHKPIIKHDNLIISSELKQFESFIILYDFEIDNIISCKENIDVSKLLTTFLYIKSCINHDYKYCYPSIEKIKYMTNINSDKSIIRYINILRDLDLILYKNAGLIKYDKDNLKYEKNVYVMNYEGNRKILNDYIEKKEIEMREKESKIVNGKNANLKRSEAMKKYWAEKKSKK